jgi:hypothetical protein
LCDRARTFRRHISDESASRECARRAHARASHELAESGRRRGKRLFGASSNRLRARGGRSARARQVMRGVAKSCVFGCVMFAFGACDGEIRFPGSSDATAPTSACTTSADCNLASLQCDTPSGVCVACTDDSHCVAPYPRCDGALHICVACGSPQDCSPGYTCTADHVCVFPCTESVQCTNSAAPTCDDDNHYCAACDDDKPCATGVCKDGQCVTCRSDAQCGAQHCQVTLGQCVACVLSSQCATGQVCDPTTWTCRD